MEAQAGCKEIYTVGVVIKWESIGFKTDNGGIGFMPVFADRSEAEKIAQDKFPIYSGHQLPKEEVFK